MSIQSSINQSIAVAGAFKAMRVKNSTAAPTAAAPAPTAAAPTAAAPAPTAAAPTAAAPAPTAAAPTAPAMQSKPYDQAKSVEALRSAMIQAQSKKALKRAVSEYIVKWREYGKK